MTAIFKQTAAGGNLPPAILRLLGLELCAPKWELLGFDCDLRLCSKAAERCHAEQNQQELDHHGGDQHPSYDFPDPPCPAVFDSQLCIDPAQLLCDSVGSTLRRGIGSQQRGDSGV